MQRYADSLIEILSEEKEIIANLYNTSCNKTNIIISSDIEALNEIVEREYEIKLAMDTAEKKRIKAVDDIAAFLGIEGRIAFSDIISRLDTPSRERLEAIYREIKKLFDEYKAVNQLNLDLIKSHLTYIDYIASILSGQNTDVPTYGADGYSDGRKKLNIFDNKA